MNLVPAEPPLDPSSEQARQWLLQELAKPAYADDRSLLRRAVDWILGRVEGVGSGGLSQLVAGVVIVGLAALVLWSLYRVLRAEPVLPARSRRRGERRSVVDIPGRTSADYRTEAAAAFAAGNFDDALIAAYRAVAAGLAEAGVLDDAPGRTAHEIAEYLGSLIPSLAADVRHAAERFDAVRYGGRRASEADARSGIDLDRAVTAATSMRA